jgi:hypothetical protein
MGTGVTMIMLAIVVALTRGWLRLYTCRMPTALADARRAELESDLWEMQHDPDLLPGYRSTAVALARLLDGIPDDIAWRFENAETEEQLLVRRVFALSAASVLVLSLWTVPALFDRAEHDVATCGATGPGAPRVDRLNEVIRCAGAFFVARQ